MRTLLRLAAMALSLTATPALAQQDFSKVEFKASHVAGKVHMLQGAGGNIAVVMGDDGLVLVDDDYAPLAPKLEAALRALSDKPLRYVLNTHFHGDHAGGNAALGRQATIVAHDNVRKRLSADGFSGTGGAFRAPYKAQPSEALPIITFGHDLTLHLNGETIRALHAPHGHTDGDAIIYFANANVAHTGDLFVRYGFPFIDIISGGSSQGMADALDRIAKTLPADVKVIPGHGAVSTLSDIREFVAMLRETRAVVAKGVADGKTAAQMKADKVLAPWQSWSRGFIQSDAFIDTLYNEITGAPGGKTQPHN